QTLLDLRLELPDAFREFGHPRVRGARGSRFSDRQAQHLGQTVHIRGHFARHGRLRIGRRRLRGELRLRCGLIGRHLLWLWVWLWLLLWLRLWLWLLRLLLNRLRRRGGGRRL